MIGANAKCSNCGAPITDKTLDNAVFDELTDNYYCDDACFDVWAEYNWSAVLAYYRKMNVS